MLVADTGALVSLATAAVVELVVAEFEIHTTSAVVSELEETAEYDDPHGQAAQPVLGRRAHVTVHEVDGF